MLHSTKDKKIPIMKYYHCTWIILFLLIITVPVYLVNTTPGAVSVAENRTLASFPIVFDDEGNFVLTKAEVEDWFDDNLGLRDQFLYLHATVSQGLFGKSSSDKVQFGTDGWMFYTGGNNIEIAYGEYTLTEELLKEIMISQLAIYDTLQSYGIEYALTLPPSKVSVYPEYLYEKLEVRKTPVDIIADYLEEHTDIPVIRLKDDLVEAKDDGLVYFQTDTHWNATGQYISYQTIMERFYELGWVSTSFSPVDVTPFQVKVRGDLVSMLSNAQYTTMVEDIALRIDNPGAERVVSDELDEHIANNTGLMEYINFINEEAESGCILVYGDSLMNFSEALLGYGATFVNCDGSTTKNDYIPEFIAEHFRKAIFFRYENNTAWYQGLDLDFILELDPDFILLELGEKTSPSLTGLPTDIRFFSIELEELPIITHPENTQMFKYGVYVDTATAEQVLTVDKSEKMLQVRGWAVDAGTNCALSDLYVQVGDGYYRCNYGMNSTDVAEYFNNPEYQNVRFAFELSVSELIDNDVDSIFLIQLGTDGSYLYEPVEYQIQYE